MAGTRRVRRGRHREPSVREEEDALPADVRRRLRAYARPRTEADAGAATDGTTDVVVDAFDVCDDGAVGGYGRIDDVLRRAPPRRPDRSGDDPAGLPPDPPGSVARRPPLWRAALADRVPVGLRGAVLAPTRRAVGALVVVLVLAVALAVLLTWWQRPRATAVPVATPHVVAAGSGAVVSPAAASVPASAAAGVVVHVVGAVRRPGLVHLAAGSRVDDAVRAAGGARHRADLASVNLARLLVDGEQIVVLRRGSTGAASGVAGVGAGGVGGAGGAAPGGDVPATPLDLNLATPAQLDALPDVGPVLAQRIVDWRTQHGRFSSVDELTEVSGIGEKTLAELRPLVRV